MSGPNTEAPDVNIPHASPSNYGMVTATATAAGGSFWWFVTQLWSNGPGWPLIPPLLFSIASLTGAIIAAMRAAEENRAKRLTLELELRHKAEKHELWMQTERVRLERGADGP